MNIHFSYAHTYNHGGPENIRNPTKYDFRYNSDPVKVFQIKQINVPAVGFKTIVS